MLGFLKALILLPIALLVVLLAVANRGPTVLSFDPFSKGQPELSITLPLFALILGSVALGVLLGGIGSWLAAGRQRRERRMSAREINRLKAEADRLRTTIVQSRPGLPSSPSASH
jgi:hypothetical protein